MDLDKIKLIIEAILVSSVKPLSLEKMQTVFDEWQKPSLQDLTAVLAELSDDYASRAIELAQVAGGYRLQTRAGYNIWIERLFTEKPGKYSRALLETLAIIAYRQPVSRGDIEDIRGVAVSSSIIKTLLEREWIRMAGHRDIPGKPAVYATTRLFLEYFNLQSLDSLPDLEQDTEIKKQELPA